jgi:uncharacterized protein
MANIVWHSDKKTFEDRKQLKKSATIERKKHQQTAAFIRIKDGKNPLDNSAVHPEWNC